MISAQWKNGAKNILPVDFIPLSNVIGLGTTKAEVGNFCWNIIGFVGCAVKSLMLK
jgi:hypothetical protein